MIYSFPCERGSQTKAYIIITSPDGTLATQKEPPRLTSRLGAKASKNPKNHQSIALKSQSSATIIAEVLFCCLSRKAVFDMAGREGKFTWNL